MKKILSFVLALAFALSILVFIPARSAGAGLPFTDVPEKAWYYKEVCAAYEAGLMNGRSETVFAPKENVTRAEIAAILARIDGADLSDTAKYAASFPDVKQGAWYMKYLGWAANKGILKGYTDGSVKPNDPVTRAELAVMMTRYAESRSLAKLPASPKVDSFSDASSFKKWYADSAETLRFAGIFAGDSAGKFNPSSNATRAEVAALSVRLSDSVDVAENTVLIASSHENLGTAVIVDGTSDVANYAADRVHEVTGRSVKMLDGAFRRQKAEIIVLETERPESQGISDGLAKFDYRIKVTDGDGFASVTVAFERTFVGKYLVDMILGEYYKNGELRLPKGTDLEKTYPFRYADRDKSDVLIETDVTQLRDPCVLLEDGVYYMYGTGWRMYKNTSGDLAGPWEGPYSVVEDPDDINGDRWAPEVYKYNGKYVMFTTYRSRSTGCRGCAVFTSESPEGPFTLHSDGQVTPRDRDAIDGTLYVDPDGQPWMIFSNEHTMTDDRVGRFSAAKMDADLTEFVSEPVELFRADSPSWSNANITDGPFLYTCEDGSLLMIWSDDDEAGYCIGIARSESGSVTGPWVQQDERLYSLTYFGDWDGGHGMIFRSIEGDMYVSFHSPNVKTDERSSNPVFLRIREENGTLVPDFTD